MELVARTSPLPRRAAGMAALAALLIASAFAGVTAAPAQAKKKAKAPVITKVSPMDVAIGEVLTIKGRYFLRGKKKNTVVFKRAGARAVFVKADIGTTKLLRVTLPAELQKVFKTKNNVAVATRFQLRVLTTRLGKKYTSKKRSPVVSAPRPPKPPQSAADGDCDGDGVKNAASTDDDNDLLPDTLEAQLNTDACKADTDGDGVEDGYEYQSALNLNDDEFQEPNGNLFYPVKLPYPNPLYGGDADIDFDGDSLTLSEEQSLWRYTWNVTHTDARTLTPLSYSDGEQYSRSVRGGDGRRIPTLAALGYDKHQQFIDWTIRSGYRDVLLHNENRWGLAAGAGWHLYPLFDLDRDGTEQADEQLYYDYSATGSPGEGWLSDNERDEDADGLTNFDEAHSRMTPGYWKTCYSMELPFHVPYAGTKIVDADTDGDGVLDGADDQDHDDVPNLAELSRYASSHLDDTAGAQCAVDPALAAVKIRHPNAFGRVNPFNPCLPDTESRTCPLYFNSGTGAPYDGSPNWFSLN
jgi:hypothetical protein